MMKKRFYGLNLIVTLMISAVFLLGSPVVKHQAFGADEKGEKKGLSKSKGKRSGISSAGRGASAVLEQDHKTRGKSGKIKKYKGGEEEKR
jgi:hypothetical protein